MNPLIRRTHTGVVLTLLALGCSDGAGPTTEHPTPLPPTPFLISSPVPTASATAAGVSRSESSGSTVVYVSLPPGAIPDGSSATIRDPRVGSSISTVLVDGGFDPVALAAAIGDTLAVVVRTGADSVLYRCIVAGNKPPIVIRTSPPPHKRDVALNSIVVIVFSEPLDSIIVDNGSVKLWHGTTPVPGTVRFADPEHLRVEFRPNTILGPETDYELVVTTAIKDLSGLALDSGFTVPFTTGTTAPPGNLVFASVSVGQYHTCGVTTAGAAYCWGANLGGLLGDGIDWEFALSPVPVAGGLTFASVSASASRTCGVTTSGAAYCWGIGVADSLGRLVPVPVANGLSFASVSEGLSHACGVTTAGAAYCWGGGHYGELGDGNPNGSITPVPVAGGHTFAEVSAGWHHSCDVTTTGVAYCWGMNTMGELGIGSSSGPDQCQNGVSYACSTLPVAVAGGLTFRTVRAAGAASCGVTTSGVPYCWGDNLNDLLGSGYQITGPEQCRDTAGVETRYDAPLFIPCSTVPVKVAGGLNLVSLTTYAGINYFACGLTSTGVASCWGANPGVALATTRPLPVPGGLTFATLSAGWTSTCGVTPAGVAYCWGTQLSSGLGDGTTSSSSAPVKVAGQP